MVRIYFPLLSEDKTSIVLNYKIKKAEPNFAVQISILWQIHTQ